MPFCRKCGKEISEGDNFCQACGISLNKKEAHMSKKSILWVSLIIAVIVAVYELTWLSKSGLAWVILILAVAVALQGVYLLRKK